jgi:hypothetical protein
MRDHYSLELLAKLRQQDLVCEELREQALRRLRPEARLSRRWKRGLLLAAVVVVSLGLLLLAV